ETALAIAEGLQDRRPELGALRSLGEVCLALGRYTEAARHFQRSLAISEAEFDQASAIIACERLGDAALAQSEWAGAEAWYGRGLRLAEGARDARGMGRLERSLAMLARKQGDLTTADVHVRRGRALVESVGAAAAMAPVPHGRGQQLDDTGFVFFEQAIELSRALERSPAISARVYVEYGLFKNQLGQHEEARGYLERAREIFESLGEAPDVERVESELQRMSA